MDIEEIFGKIPETAQEFLDCMMVREFMDCEFHSTAWMSEQEMKESIIQDILTFTMEENKFPGEKLFLDFGELTRFVNNKSVNFAVGFVTSAEFQALVLYGEKGYRVKPEREILQAAMDYCGVYWEGFKMPPDCICVDREAFKEQVDKHGGLNNFATALEMDIQASVPTQSNVH